MKHVNNENTENTLTPQTEKTTTEHLGTSQDCSHSETKTELK